MLAKRFLRISEICTVRLLALYIFIIVLRDHMLIKRVLLELGCIFTVLLSALHFRLLFDIPAEAGSIFVKELKMLFWNAKQLRYFTKFPRYFDFFIIFGCFCEFLRF